MTSSEIPARKNFDVKGKLGVTFFDAAFEDLRLYKIFLGLWGNSTSAAAAA
jgi:hypothetical protein